MSDYNRPNQLWQCADDCDCPLGPTKWGVCRSTSARCRPRLSLRGRRGVFIASCVFATLGLLLLALLPAWRMTVLKPGPLSNPHAQALAHATEANKCAACHEAAEKDPTAWLAIATGNVTSLSEGQAARCLHCHEASFGPNARNPHNVSPEALARTTRRIAGESATLQFLRVRLAGNREQACATCHKEHHGLHANLTQLTDQQCQSCHVQAFESFTHGHPEFRRTLPSRRSEITFDHVSHVQKHFPDKQQAFACSQCHVDDARRDVKRLAGFEQSCAKCHSKPIEAASLEGIAAFSFPTLDVAKLKAAGHDIGQWPAAATGDFDGALPPLVRGLLMADEEAAAALEELGPKYSFADTAPKDLENVARLAWSYKRLLNDLANESTAIEKRLRGANFAAAPPPALFREARRRWLPQLSAELAAAGRTQPRKLATTAVYPQVRSEWLAENPLNTKPQNVEAPKKVEPLPESSGRSKVGETASEPPKEVTNVKTVESVSVDPNELASFGGWYLDDATLSIRYRPRGHADELVKLVIDNAAAATSPHLPEDGALPATLADPAFKSCATCHSIDTAGDRYSVNWQIQYRDTSRRQFTEFSHRPHLLQSKLADCTQCHKLNVEREPQTSAMLHAHDFQPIQKAQCASCHGTAETSGRCTTCHSYHAGAVKGHP